MVSIIGLESIKRANAEHGHHWFEAGTLRFFRSRVAQHAYRGPGGTFFVSSEQFRASNGWLAPRLYSVRRVNADGSIDTEGEFQRFKSRSGANAAARKLAAGTH